MKEDKVKNKIVTITRDGAACKVAPRALEVNPGDTVTFHNVTGKSVSLLMSDETVFEEYRLKIEPKLKASTVVRDVPSGEYPYAVFCREIDDFAQASSMPIIIVRPR